MTKPHPRPPRVVTRPGSLSPMPWSVSHRADPAALRIADRHYNRQKPGTPQFVPPGNDDARTLFLALGLVFAVMTFVVFIGYGLLAAWVRDYVISRPGVMSVIRWCFALAFLALALRLALETIVLA